MRNFFSKDTKAKQLGKVVLVTGGAGYIGSHACKALKEAGYSPVVYDSLVSGSKEAVKWGPLVVGDINDLKSLEKAFKTYNPFAVMHFAALCKVGESVKHPSRYYTINVQGSINLLNVMKKFGVKNIIFSSSCTIYGDNPKELSEVMPKVPANPYARTKHVMEQVIKDYASAYGMHYMILRYFNAAGVDAKAGLKRIPGSYPFLIYRVMQALVGGEGMEIYGANYDTVDGTGVRDYIHVSDLANAHVQSLKYIEHRGESEELNLGTGKGYSVLEVIEEVEKVTNKKVPFNIKPRRKGDVGRAVANNEKAKKIIQFEPEYSDLDTIINSEWEAIKKKGA